MYMTETPQLLGIFNTKKSLLSSFQEQTFASPLEDKKSD